MTTGSDVRNVRGLSEIELPGITPWRRGKVRVVFEAGERHLVMVASDRLSAYDVVLPTPIPDKGRILTQLSSFWMRTLASASPHHLVSDDPRTYPAPFDRHASLLAGRSQLVRRAEYTRSARPPPTIIRPVTTYRASSAPVNGSVVPPPPPPPVDSPATPPLA